MYQWRNKTSFVFVTFRFGLELDECLFDASESRGRQSWGSARGYARIQAFKSYKLQQKKKNKMVSTYNKLNSTRRHQSLWNQCGKEWLCSREKVYVSVGNERIFTTQPTGIYIFNKRKYFFEEILLIRQQYNTVF